MTSPSKRFRIALLAATLIAGVGGIAAAQMAPTYNPSQLPATKGKVAQYSLTPRGDVDGLILNDGTQIHLPPQLGTQLVFAVKPGDTVTVRGLKARELPLVQAMQVTNDASGQSVTDTGPAPGGPGPKHDEKGKKDHGPGPRAASGEPMQAQGPIKAQLYGPRGDLNGVLLADGTIVHLPPQEAQRLAGQLAVGQTLFVRGAGIKNSLGKLIMARAIGPDEQHATPLQEPPHGGWLHGLLSGSPHGGSGAPPPPDDKTPVPRL